MSLTILVLSLLSLKLIDDNLENMVSDNLVKHSFLIESVYDARFHTFLDAGSLLVNQGSFLHGVRYSDSAFLKSNLNSLSDIYSIDLVYVVDNDAKFMAGIKSDLSGRTIDFNGSVKRALVSGVPLMSTQIIPASFLELEDNLLCLQSTVRKVPSLLKDYDIDEVYINDSLAQVVIIPFDLEGSQVGALILIDVLNRDENLPLEVAAYAGGEFAYGFDFSVYLNDVTIATNTLTSNGYPYIGVLMPKQVSQVVLENGQPFFGRVWDKNNWSRKVYVPLRDYNSDVVGALSFGILEKDFRNQKFIFDDLDISHLIIIIAVALVIISLYFAYVISVRIIRPVKDFTKSIDQVVAGNYEQGVSLCDFDELNDLAKHYNVMVRSIRAAVKKKNKDTNKYKKK